MKLLEFLRDALAAGGCGRLLWITRAASRGMVSDNQVARSLRLGTAGLNPTLIWITRAASRGMVSDKP